MPDEESGPSTADVLFPSEPTGFERWKPILVALALIGAHVLLAVLLLVVVLQVSSAVGGGEISGKDDLYRLGSDARSAAAGALIPIPIGATAAFAVILSARRPRAWVPVVMAMGASVVLCALFLATLHAPTPIVGG